jgi:hypothetical protein
MQGYDVSMMGGMNIIPQYSDYFHLSRATQSLNVATNYIGGCLAVISPYIYPDDYLVP